MLTVGLMLYAFMSHFGHYYVEGVGYATIQDVLTSVQFPLYLLILLFVAKLVATSLTLGSGASGGVFSPALFLGATTGGAYGLVLHRFFPALNISAPAFAVAGMAGVVGGSTGAAMAAIVMIFEMTLDYTVIIPMTLVVAISYGLRRSVTKDSIYTRKLVLRGDPVPESLRADLQFTRRASSIMNTKIEIFPAATRLQDLRSTGIRLSSSLTGRAQWRGVVTGESLNALVHANPTDAVGDVVQRNYVVVSPGDSVWQVVAAMRSTDSAFALVAAQEGFCQPVVCKES